MAGKNETQTSGLPATLRVFVVSTVFANVLSVLACALWSMRFGPVIFYLLYPKQRGFDFFDYFARFHFRHSATFFSLPGYPWYYPAPAIFVHYPFYILSSHEQIDYCIFATLAVALWSCFLYFLGRSLRKLSIRSNAAFLYILVVFISYPVFFAIERGNIEAFTWIVLALGIYTFAQGRHATSAVLLGVAASFKLYPIVFLLLFLQRKKLKFALLSIAVCALVTLAGLRFLEPNVADAARRTFHGIQSWTQAYGENWRQEAVYDHSFFGVYKAVTRSTGSYHTSLTIYLAAAAVLFAVIFFVRVRKLPVLNQVVFLTTFVVLFPTTSFDYTLCNLYIPFAWITCYAVRARTRHVKGLKDMFCLFGLVLAAETFTWLPGFEEGPGVLRAVELLLLAGLSAQFPLEEPDPAAGAELPLPLVSKTIDAQPNFA